LRDERLGALHDDWLIKIGAPSVFEGGNLNVFSTGRSDIMRKFIGKVKFNADASTVIADIFL